jgi:hypothetical protein
MSLFVMVSGARMLQHSNSANEMLLRRKLEEQQQAAELQQAIELHSRRLMGLQLLDFKSRAAAAPTPIGNPFSASQTAANATGESPPDSGELGKGSGFLLAHKKAVNGADKEESTGESSSPNTDSDQRWNFAINILSHRHHLIICYFRHT